MDSAHPGPGRPEPRPGGGPSSRPSEEGATIAPPTPNGKLRPGEEQCFVQGHAEGLEARFPAPRRVPAARPAPASLPGAAAGDAAPTARRPGRHAGSAGPPYLDDGRAGGGGVRIRFRAPRRPPSPRAQSHRLLPHSLAGGAGGRGRRLAQPRPRTPRGHPSFSTPPTALPAPRGWPRGVHTRTDPAHTPACTRRSDWGGLSGDPPGLTSRRSLAAWDGTRDSTSRSLRFPLGGMETVIVSVSGSR